MGLLETERTAAAVEGIDGCRCSHAILDGPYAGRSAVHSWSCHRCINAVSQTATARCFVCCFYSAVLTGSGRHT